MSKKVGYRLNPDLIARVNGIAERMEMRPSFVLEGMILHCLDKLNTNNEDISPSYNKSKTGAPSNVNDDGERIRKLLQK
jgi:predicted transcriptional regulator